MKYVSLFAMLQPDKFTVSALVKSLQPGQDPKLIRRTLQLMDTVGGGTSRLSEIHLVLQIHFSFSIKRVFFQGILFFSRHSALDRLRSGGCPRPFNLFMIFLNFLDSPRHLSFLAIISWT